MKVLRICIRGLTASFRIPFAITGVQLSLPVPPYSAILGMISSCAGKNITEKDTQIGFEFTAESKAFDLERFIRWKYNTKRPGTPILNPDGPSVRQREFLINPTLILYLTNLQLINAFQHPKGIITLGRSQDLAWIESIDEIELIITQEGVIGGTLIPFDLCKSSGINGLLIRIPEIIEYDEKNLQRHPKNNTMFLATNTEKTKRSKIKLSNDLYTSKAFSPPQHCIYLHQWMV